MTDLNEEHLSMRVDTGGSQSNAGNGMRANEKRWVVLRVGKQEGRDIQQ